MTDHPPAAPPPPAGVTAAAVGEDAAGGRGVFDGGAPGGGTVPRPQGGTPGPWAAPDAGLLGPAAGPLPPAAAGFAGRERELAQLRAEIDRPGLGADADRRARVLLVAGRPGTGRTALALRLAREVADRYPDGQYLLRPAAGDPPAQLSPGLLSGRRVLLVLDDVSRADQVTGLLPGAAGSLVIATSAGPLSGVADVRPCTLGGLDTAAAVELLAHTIGATRVTNDPRGAETLVQEVAGHPTALRLVAAWLAARPRLSVADAAARLRAVPADPFGPPGPHPAPAELVRAFRLVHAGLPPTAARILRLLVLAPAGLVDAQVASALAGCPVPTARSTLDDFVAGGLLSDVPHRRVPGCLAPLLHGLTGSADRPEDLRLARARMLERTVRLLHACRAALAGGPAAQEVPPALRFASGPAAADWLRSRQPALLDAARTAVADGQLDTLAQRLVTALVRTLASAPGPDSTARARYELHTLLLDVAERRGLHRAQAAALINLGDLDAEAGRSGPALDHYRRALAAARAGDDAPAEGRALESLGSAYLARQDPQRAADWYGRALALRQARGELADQARLHGRIGALLASGGRHGAALREWRSAAGAHRRLGDLPAQARALAEAAQAQEDAGHPEDALRTCRDALHCARQAGEQGLEAAMLLRLAGTLDRLGDPSGAALQRAAAARLTTPAEPPHSAG